MQQPLTYRAKDVATATTGDVDVQEVTASGNDLDVRSIFMKVNDVVSSNADVSYEVFQATARTAGSAITAGRGDRRAGATPSSSSSKAPTGITTAGQVDGAVLPVGTGFYQAYAKGELVIKSGEFLVLRANRNGAAGSAANTNVVVKLWD